MENVQNSTWNVIHLLINMTGNLFKNPCNMYPLFWQENCRWLAPGHGRWVAGPGEGTSMLPPIWYTPWFSQELWKYIQLRTVSGCNVNIHYSPFLEHYLSPKSQGRVILCFSLTPNMWSLYQQHPIPQTPTGCSTSPFTSDGNRWSYCRFWRLGALQRATGTPGPFWRHTACCMLPAPSAPGHSSLGTQANQAPGMWHQPRSPRPEGNRVSSSFLFSLVKSSK